MKSSTRFSTSSAGHPLRRAGRDTRLRSRSRTTHPSRRLSRGHHRHRQGMPAILTTLIFSPNLVDGSFRRPPLPQMDETPTVTAALDDVERTYKEQSEKLWRSLLLFSGDPEVASDAVAEAFAQVLRRGAAVRDVDRWVWTAAFRIARGELKRRRAHESLSSDVADAVPGDVPTETVDLIRALTQLSRNSGGRSSFTTTPATRTRKRPRSSARPPRRWACTSSAAGGDCEPS